MTTKVPPGLSAGGRVLWRAVSDGHELNEVQRVQLLEACRAKDRLDRLDLLLRGDADSWATLIHDLRTDSYELKIDAALVQANATANMLKQLLASLRLPDEAGKRPQRRGAARGTYAEAKATGVSSIERARAAKAG